MALPDALRFKKRYVIPLWIVRIGLMLLIIAIYGIALHYAKDNDLSKTIIAIVVLFMLALIICLLLDILAIVLFARDALHPKTFLIFNICQCSIWAIIIILDIVSITRGGSAAGLGLSFVVFLSFFALLVYSMIKYRREKAEGRRGQYVPATNPAAPMYGQQQYGYMPPPHPPQAHELNSPAYPQGAANGYYAQPYTGAHGQHASAASGPQQNPFADPYHKQSY